MLQKNKGGRPQLEDAEKLSRHIHIRITESEFKELEKKHRQAAMTMGRYIVQAVKNAELQKDQGAKLLGEIQMMDLSKFLRSIIASSEVNQAIPIGAETELRKISDYLKDISRDARTIASKVSGEHYHTVYADTLLRMQAKAQNFINEYLKQKKTK